MASRRSSWGGAMETYWAAPAAARDHVAALGRPSTVCVPVGSARIAQGGAQQHGDHEASITPIVGCQPDFGCQSIVGCTDCPAGKHSLSLSNGAILSSRHGFETIWVSWHSVSHPFSRLPPSELRLANSSRSAAGRGL